MKLIIISLCLICMATVNGAIGAERPQKVKAQTAATDGIQQPVPNVPSILSIVPAQGEPGSRVTIFGSAFGDQVTAMLGTVEIPARVTDGNRLEFQIPKLDAGLYALYLKRSDGVVGRVYNFNVLALRPVLESVAPDRVSACAAGAEREITVSGQNFTDSSMVLFDGAVVSGRVVSSQQIVFTVPDAAGGMHQIMVKNDQDNGTLPRAMVLETKPEVSQVSIGTESVNYYELNIYGRNFQQNSSIYVDGQRIGGKGGQEMIEREKLIYVDCNRLIYQRYPYSPVNKDFRIQVVNQGGEASQTVNVTAP